MYPQICVQWIAEASSTNEMVTTMWLEELAPGGEGCPDAEKVVQALAVSPPSVSILPCPLVDLLMGRGVVSCRTCHHAPTSDVSCFDSLCGLPLPPLCVRFLDLSPSSFLSSSLHTAPASHPFFFFFLLPLLPLLSSSSFSSSSSFFLSHSACTGEKGCSGHISSVFQSRTDPPGSPSLPCAPLCECSGGVWVDQPPPSLLTSHLHSTAQGRRGTHDFGGVGGGGRQKTTSGKDTIAHMIVYCRNIGDGPLTSPS